MFVKYVHLQTLPIDKSIDEPWCQPVNPQKWRRPEYEKTRGLINPRSMVNISLNLSNVVKTSGWR